MKLTNVQRVFEEWKPIVGYEGLYEVSSMGRVRSLDRILVRKSRWGGLGPHLRKGKILAERTRDHGYVAVMFGAGGKDIPIHHLVADAFIERRPVGMIINHKNGDKSDNRKTNLEWVTWKGNRQHAISTGLSRSNAGRKWKQMSSADVKEVRKEYGKTLSSVLAKKYGVSQTTISRIGLRQIFKTV